MNREAVTPDQPTSRNVDNEILIWRLSEMMINGKWLHAGIEDRQQAMEFRNGKHRPTKKLLNMVGHLAVATALAIMTIAIEQQ